MEINDKGCLFDFYRSSMFNNSKDLFGNFVCDFLDTRVGSLLDTP